jgi:hypothetical protein
MGYLGRQRPGGGTGVFRPLINSVFDSEGHVLKVETIVKRGFR